MPFPVVRTLRTTVRVTSHAMVSGTVGRWPMEGSALSSINAPAAAARMVAVAPPLAMVPVRPVTTTRERVIPSPMARTPRTSVARRPVTAAGLAGTAPTELLATTPMSASADPAPMVSAVDLCVMASVYDAMAPRRVNRLVPAPISRIRPTPTMSAVWLHAMEAVRAGMKRRAVPVRETTNAPPGIASMATAAAVPAPPPAAAVTAATRGPVTTVTVPVAG